MISQLIAIFKTYTMPVIKTIQGLNNTVKLKCDVVCHMIGYKS